MVAKKVISEENEPNNVSDSQIKDSLKNSRVLKQEKACGVIMPISAIDGLSESHWIEVKGIIESSIMDAGFSPNLVSDADESGIIQKRIIQNLYDNPIVVCDVSCKNPNVMFELGLRLAFDKSTIVIKDDKTDYSFDTSVIEHLVYPRDLRFNQIVGFKSKLTSKINATFEKSKDENYSTFLKNFGTFKIAKLDEKEVPAEQFIIDRLSNIENKLDNYKKYNSNNDIKFNASQEVNTEKCWVPFKRLNFEIEHNVPEENHDCLIKDINDTLIEFKDKISALENFKLSITPNLVFFELGISVSSERSRNAVQNLVTNLAATIIQGYENH